jgi:leucyl-tRNA synthetase
MKNLNECRKDLQTYTLERFAVMIAPLAPHLGEECWKMLGNEKSLFDKPVCFVIDEKALSVDNMTIVIQINGKVRSKIDLPVNTSEAEVKQAVFADEKVKSYTDNKQVVKEIYVPNKIYTIVIK